jgi:hypothetical protein
MGVIASKDGRLFFCSFTEDIPPDGILAIGRGGFDLGLIKRD